MAIQLLEKIKSELLKERSPPKSFFLKEKRKNY